MGQAANLLIKSFLDENGDGSGNSNAIGDYSVTPQEFYYQCPANHQAAIHRLIISAEDTSGMGADDYGKITGGLTVGYFLLAKDAQGATLLDLTNGLPIKTNGGLTWYCYDVDIHTWGNGNEYLAARWTFAQSGIPLYLGPGERLSVTFNDDLSGLINHRFKVQGHYY